MSKDFRPLFAPALAQAEKGETMLSAPPMVRFLLLVGPDEMERLLEAVK